MRRLILGLAAAVALWIPVTGRSADGDLAAAALAWDKGDYVSALTTYLRVLDSPGWESAFETIALQSGELFETVELTTDGDAPTFAPDGRHLSYETGALPRRVTRIAASTDPRRPLAELEGFRGAFSPDGLRFAYLKVTATQELERAAAAVDEGPPGERTQRLNAFNARIALESVLVVRDLTTGVETPLPTGRLRKTGVAFTADGVIVSGSEEGTAGQLYAARPNTEPVALTTGDGEKVLDEVDARGRALTFTIRVPGGGRGGDGGGRGGPARFGLVTFPGGNATVVNGSAPALAADGSAVAYVAREGGEYRLIVAPLGEPQRGTALRRGAERIDAPAFSPNGQLLVYQLMPREDWEIYAIDREGSERRLTREIQHDVLPRFLTPDRMLATIGEARHRRSHIYDLSTGSRTRLFHNNTIRTIAPEYAWVPSPDGTKVLIVAERDGDTVSPERGVYLVDLTRRITRDTLRARLRANLQAEQALRVHGQRIFAPIAADVRRVVGDASVARVFAYQKALFDFDSKHITQPGNRKAAQYLFDTYRSFGYAPAFQEFSAAQRGNQQPIRTANVLATLEGTVNPELVYVVSSHFDSVAVGPGADDDSSGTAALLETARIMARHPQPATIVFASFTGEEAGLLGSREYVRQAVANGVRIVGALNNDMIGWANDHRLDNTVRYSNAGIRDVQHGAAMQFTNLITYDALYYKSTDAAAYYEAYGDIVGGIGSYPVLGNPHYHQSHDVLETINHQLVTEVAKTTAATLMLLASSPSRLTDVKVESFSGDSARISWTPSPEKGVTGYIVAYGPASNPDAQRLRVTRPSATLQNVTSGTRIAVKAVNAGGLEGWDWARTVIP